MVMDALRRMTCERCHHMEFFPAEEATQKVLREAGWVGMEASHTDRMDLCGDCKADLTTFIMNQRVMPRSPAPVKPRSAVEFTTGLEPADG